MFDLEKAGLLAALMLIMFESMGFFVDQMVAGSAASPVCWREQPVYAKSLGKNLFRIEGPEYASSGKVVRYVKYGTVRRRDISFETWRCWKPVE